MNLREIYRSIKKSINLIIGIKSSPHAPTENKQDSIIIDEHKTAPFKMIEILDEKATAEKIKNDLKKSEETRPNDDERPVVSCKNPYLNNANPFGTMVSGVEYSVANSKRKSPPRKIIRLEE